MPTPAYPPRIALAPGLEIPRVVTGLWQVADQERGGRLLDPDAAAQAMAGYAQAGFDAFDMADHYGSAEDIAGRFLARHAGPGAACFTKWCPEPGPMTRAAVRAGVGRSMERLGVATVDLMQFHWWSFAHPAYLDAMREMAAMKDEGLIRALGVTNFDTDHLRVLVGMGVPVATNQVSFSLVDRRAREDLTALCRESGTKLLAYGTLCGGFLTDRWVGRPEPTQADIPDWSKSKYRRFIDAIGGWGALQTLLAAAKAIADRHRASRWRTSRLAWVAESRRPVAAIHGQAHG